MLIYQYPKWFDLPRRGFTNWWYIYAVGKSKGGPSNFIYRDGQGKQTFNVFWLNRSFGLMFDIFQQNMS